MRYSKITITIIPLLILFFCSTYVYSYDEGPTFDLLYIKMNEEKATVPAKGGVIFSFGGYEGGKKYTKREFHILIEKDQKILNLYIENKFIIFKTGEKPKVKFMFSTFCTGNDLKEGRVLWHSRCVEQFIITMPKELIKTAIEGKEIKF